MRRTDFAAARRLPRAGRRPANRSPGHGDDSIDFRNGLHFISGLPRSGTTLLSALLRQVSQENEAAVFIDDDQRPRILRACVQAFHGDIRPDEVVFDINRQWTTRLSLLARLYPGAKVICRVRSPAWVLDPIESLIRRNPLERSGIFRFDSGGAVCSRAEGLMSGTGMIGYALNGLREAWVRSPARAPAAGAL